ncbi:hypothetical protein C450_13382 [Halococcus salifodinae DSM 8989]|uniref:Uncharacterized protein n=2 Tax=Halococcus salifodinae TaxID=36738 RepID=M0MZE2_9EURY|nr:hypothetical protein C450_13382 [Halococcus salifodinae DSM 8989]
MSVVRYIQEVSEEYDSEDNLSESDGRELEMKVGAWRRLLENELGKEQRIAAADVGLLDVDGLLNRPESLFDDTVWNWLDGSTKADVKEACKTLVIDCPTSSVILSLRALERCLRVWHEEKTENKLEAAWGTALGQLISEFQEKTDSNDVMEQLSDLPPVLSNLFYLKEKRNEVSHPDKSPTSQEARRSLMIMAATITEIHEEIYDEKVVEYENGDFENVDVKGLSAENAFLTLVYEFIEQGFTDNGAVDVSRLKAVGSKVDISENKLENGMMDALMSGEGYEPKEGQFTPI